jgi:hypothetical protein
MAMQNCEITVDGNKLFIEVETNRRLGLSKTGKTILVASSLGNERVQLEDGTILFVGLNVYTYPEK